MKYQRLAKEQLEELHTEFINFLATQTITDAEWKDIKKNKPEVAEQEIDVFSDLVWEGVLNKVNYVEHFSEQQIHLFTFEAENMRVIAVKLKNDAINLTTKEGFKWFSENLMDERIEFLQAKKEYADEKNLDIFKLIQQGAAITKGELFNFLDKIIN